MRIVDSSHIMVEPDVLGGEPHIAGRRIGVAHIATWIVYQGASPEDIANEFHLSLGEVHAALAYYYDHKDEIDAVIATSQQRASRTADMFETIHVDDHGRAMRAIVKLDERTIQQIRDILVRHGVTHAGVFGSFARGEADLESDVDILIESPPGMTLFDLAGLGNDLELALGRSVDLVTYRSLNQRIRDNVLNDEKVIL
jgi:predicted nucleotidyltransferase/uncharacterized protein (DUF433 family)